MPQAPRKTAAAKPDDPETDVVKTDASEPKEAVPTGVDSSPAAAGHVSAKDAPASETDADADADAPTFHWQTATGQPGTPCRVCYPAGPPIGAGSVGCPHGQWVLAPDAD